MPTAAQNLFVKLTTLESDLCPSESTRRFAGCFPGSVSRLMENRRLLATLYMLSHNYHKVQHNTKQLLLQVCMYMCMHYQQHMCPTDALLYPFAGCSCSCWYDCMILPVLLLLIRHRRPSNVEPKAHSLDPLKCLLQQHQYWQQTAI